MITSALANPRDRRTASTAHRLVSVALAGITLASVSACSSHVSDVDAAPAPDVSAADATNSPASTNPPATGGASTTDPKPTSTATPTATPTRMAGPPTRPTIEVDRLVDVNGIRLYLHCEGSGAVTVVLIAGFESSSSTWSAVAPTLADRTRVCSYDRPGLGMSPPAMAIQTFSSQAADLVALLDAAGEVGPYVVVGHSFGGVQAIEFVSELGDAALGLLLVDASPIGWPTTLCAIPDDGTQAATFLRGMCDGWTDPTSNAEHLDVFTSFDEIVSPPSFGSLPVAVLTATARQLPPDITDSERHRLDEAWAFGQQRWASLSDNTHITSVAEAGHFIQLDRPDVVVDAIEALLP